MVKLLPPTHHNRKIKKDRKCILVLKIGALIIIDCLLSNDNYKKLLHPSLNFVGKLSTLGSHFIYNMCSKNKQKGDQQKACTVKQFTALIYRFP
jgi:hypothetical protein